jgi:hypothetical protein
MNVNAVSFGELTANRDCIYRAGRDAHATTIAQIKIDCWPTLKYKCDCFDIATVPAGLADDLIPGDAGVVIKSCFTQFGLRHVVINEYRTGFYAAVAV